MTSLNIVGRHSVDDVACMRWSVCESSEGYWSAKSEASGDVCMSHLDTIEMSKVVEASAVDGPEATVHRIDDLTSRKWSEETGRAVATLSVVLTGLGSGT